MNDEKLIERLRCPEAGVQTNGAATELMEKAADRIEALLDERDDLRDRSEIYAMIRKEWTAEMRLGREEASTYAAHRAWSNETFGADRGPLGSLRHLIKEAGEAIETPDDVTEYADCLLLVWDAAARAGFDRAALIRAASDKLVVLEKRTYERLPDGKPSQHVRDS